MGKPGLPQGMRDFASATVYKRNFILDTIRKVFELYGYEPLETPAMENLDTLMGKYGEEGDKLIFKILNNGLNDPKNIDKARDGFQKLLEGKNTAALTERALKYDLTIPFARYVAMNAGSMVFPYRRYQVQPVWRADRPQRGRYREFTQCDADVLGSKSLVNELELCHIYHRCFTSLGLTDYVLKINNRKILAALAEIAGGAQQLINITVAIDKLDNIGMEKVKEELSSRGISDESVVIIEKYLSVSGSNGEKLEALERLFPGSAVAKEGLNELRYVTAGAKSVRCEIDLTLARGLNYYTGIIFEIQPPATIKMGSLGGGGRYDDLTGLFGVPGIPGVGISFGIDRIYDVMEELALFPPDISGGPAVIFFNLGEKECRRAMTLLNNLRDENIACELYPDEVKLDRQFKYADKKNISYAVIIGTKELESGSCMVKELKTGIQTEIPFDELVIFFRDKVK